MREAGRRSRDDRRHRRECREARGKDGESSVLLARHGRGSRLGFQVPGARGQPRGFCSPACQTVGPSTSTRATIPHGGVQWPAVKAARKSAHYWTSAAPPGIAHSRWPSPPAHRGRGRPHAREAHDEGDYQGAHRSASYGAMANDRGRTENATIQRQPLAERPSHHSATPIPGLAVGNPTGRRNWRSPPQPVDEWGSSIAKDKRKRGRRGCQEGEKHVEEPPHCGRCW